MHKILSLSTIPGFCFGHPPGPARPRVVHFPTLIGKEHLQQRIVMHEKEWLIDEIIPTEKSNNLSKTPPKHDFSFENESLKTIHLGDLFAARSGDKGGNANLGVWGKTPDAYAFLKQFLTVEKLKQLLKDAAPFEIKVYDFPNLLGLNFYIIGFLGDGVAASAKMDAQAKTLGEYLRAKVIEVPASLVE